MIAFDPIAQERDRLAEQNVRLMAERQALRSLCMQILGRWVREADGEDGGDIQRGAIAQFRREYDELAKVPR